MGLSLTTTHSSSGQLVEKHIEGSNPTAPGNDEISPGDTIDLVAATNGALAGIVEHAIFGPELVDGRAPTRGIVFTERSEEHTSELQSLTNLVCRLLLE